MFLGAFRHFSKIWVGFRNTVAKAVFFYQLQTTKTQNLDNATETWNYLNVFFPKEGHNKLSNIIKGNYNY